MRRWPNSGIMLGHRLRHWPSFKPALDQRLCLLCMRHWDIISSLKRLSVVFGEALLLMPTWPLTLTVYTVPLVDIVSLLTPSALFKHFIDTQETLFQITTYFKIRSRFENQRVLNVCLYIYLMGFKRRLKLSIVGSLRDREVACSASDRQGANFESCVRRAVSFQSSHHPQEVLLAQFSLFVHKGGLKPDLFHLKGV